ncbi:MAG TPA: C25 family cysteine peptidase [Blastocatellia bacterium]|nr:C25 family cysteine peptidase [Blastocatellia bacterium]
MANPTRRTRSAKRGSPRNGDRENFFGPVIAQSATDLSLTLTHLAEAGSPDSLLEVALQGVTLSAHLVRVELNGEAVGEVNYNGQGQGRGRFRLLHSLLVEGENRVRLTGLNGVGDISLVDYVRISYEHALAADEEMIKLEVGGNQTVRVGGFSHDRIRVVDVTEADTPLELTGKVEREKSGYSVRFASPEEGERKLMAFTAERSPESLTANRPSELRKANADFIIITRREFADALRPLVSLRQRQGLSVAVVDIEDIYDEFGFGQKSPFAMRDFLSVAKSSWKRKPQYVLFAADASYDPKNYLGQGDSDLVPTRLIDTLFMETASDDWFSDFNNDGIADIATGRLPARTAHEAALIVDKIIRYETGAPAEELLLAADANDGYNFERAISELRPLVPQSLRVTQINRGGTDGETARANLREGLERGQKIVNYSGHGSVDQWGGNLLTAEDARQLRNVRLPVFLMMTCLNGYFHDAAIDSLGELLLKAEQGGAAAVWASSGMNEPAGQEAMNRELYRSLFTRGQVIRLGEAILQAKAAVADTDIRRTWILLGDPAMKLK